jgi:uncharacterized protein (TIGR02594 family)
MYAAYQDRSWLDTAVEAAAPIPVSLVIAANATVPWWREWLAGVSDTAVVTAQFVALLLAALKMYESYKDRNTSTDSRGDATRNAITAAGTAAGATKGAAASSAAGALALVAALAAALWIFSPKRAEAAPAILPKATQTSGRKRSRDDDGAEGTSDASTSTDGPVWMQEARGLIGTHEGTARKPNPVVQALFADAGFPEIRNTVDTAWCAAGVNACLERNGIPGSKSLAARSFLKWGEAIDKPVIGCVVVLWRNKPSSWEGHVGFYEGETATHIKLLGFNQSDSVNVSTYPKSRVLGYRMPRAALKTERAGIATAATGAIAVASSAVQHIEPLQEPLRATGIPHAIKIAAFIGLAAAVITVVSGIYIARQRRADYKARGQ